MTTLELNPDSEPSPPNWEPPSRSRFDRLMERLGEWFNPILVKEARQSLKSRQFVLTFGLVLLAGWIWSIVGVSFMSPDIYYSSRGNDMLAGYYWILAFPLFVIVPFGAFRSLAVEIEDGTFELISVSTLTPHQIVGGKLSSALLQGLVYFSALSPCILFTYLLRGIDMTSIGLLLFYSVYVSILLSVTGLFLATISPSKVWQMLITVGLVIGLFLLFFYASTGVAQLLQFNRPAPIASVEFWETQVAFLSVSGSFGILFYSAAAARVTFPSENRSTRLRWIMMLQQFILIAWMAYLMLRVQELMVGLTFTILGAIYWYLMGALMLGESPRMSNRIRRTLPQTSVGKTFLSWLMPGPFSGYQFAMMNMLAIAIFATVLIGLIEPTSLRPRSASPGYLRWQLFIVVGYVAVYLGLTRLIVQLIGRVSPTSPFLALLIGTLVLMVGAVAPVMLRLSFENVPRNGYFLWEISNPFSTLSYLASGRTGGTRFGSQLWSVRFIVIFAGAAIYLATTAIGFGQLRVTHEAAPQRVRDEQQLAKGGRVKKDADATPEPHPLDSDQY